jgi:hypothetical protein
LSGICFAFLLIQVIFSGYRLFKRAAPISFLAERLSTPLQIEQYLALAMTEAYQVGVKPITSEFMETVLAIGLDDLEPSLIRHGYNAKSLAELLNVIPNPINKYL